MKKAFTLAEIIIALVIIGVLTAILVPAIKENLPNQKILKFKSAHETLYKVIDELVKSDKYYLAGDLGKNPMGN